MVRAAGILGVAFAAATASYAHATVLTLSSQSIPLSLTDWEASNSDPGSDFPSLSFAKFNPALGTLTSVLVQLTGSVSGGMQIENLDHNHAHVMTGNLEAQIEVDGPAAIGPIVVVLPLATQSVHLAKYDGRLDYAGTSGITVNGLQASASNNGNVAAADFGYFEGPGNVSLDVAADSQSTASGSGNAASMFNTNAGASVDVVYTYTVPSVPSHAGSPVPEPAALPVIGAALACLFGILRRRAA